MKGRPLWWLLLAVALVLTAACVPQRVPEPVARGQSASPSQIEPRVPSDQERLQAWTEILEAFPAPPPPPPGVPRIRMWQVSSYPQRILVPPLDGGLLADTDITGAYWTSTSPERYVIKLTMRDAEGGAKFEGTRRGSGSYVDVRLGVACPTDYCFHHTLLDPDVFFEDFPVDSIRGNQAWAVHTVAGSISPGHSWLIYWYDDADGELYEFSFDGVLADRISDRSLGQENIPRANAIVRYLNSSLSYVSDHPFLNPPPGPLIP